MATAKKAATRKKPTVQELLDQAKTYWICPVTGVKIEATDTAAIAAHISEIKEKEKEKEAQKALKQQVKVYTKKLNMVSTVKDFENWVNEVLATLSDTALAPIKCKVLEIPADGNWMQNRVYIGIHAKSDLTATKALLGKFLQVMSPTTLKSTLLRGSYSTYAKSTLQKFFESHPNIFKEVSFICGMPASTNALSEKINDFCQKLGKPVKVDLPTKEILHKNKEYVDKVEKLKTLHDKIRSIKKEISTAEAELAEIRFKAFEPPTFKD